MLQKLLSLPGVLETDMASLDGKLKNMGSDSRAQKEAMRDVLRRAAIVAVRRSPSSSYSPLPNDNSIYQPQQYQQTQSTTDCIVVPSACEGCIDLGPGSVKWLNCACLYTVTLYEVSYSTVD